MPNAQTRDTEAWVAGEVLIDLIPDGGGGRRRIGGGGGANTAKALARLGVRTAFIDGISGDEYGVEARAELERSGVDLSLVQVSTLPTARAEVTLDGVGNASYGFGFHDTATFDFAAEWPPCGAPAALHVGTLAPSWTSHPRSPRKDLKKASSHAPRVDSVDHARRARLAPPMNRVARWRATRTEASWPTAPSSAAVAASPESRTGPRSRMNERLADGETLPARSTCRTCTRFCPATGRTREAHVAPPSVE
ncbi:MAG: hypothetical protein EBS51_10125 [Planctomycetia bacterium]|nr:hypothetical protein [Planctomycetia bacterium]